MPPNKIATPAPNGRRTPRTAALYARWAGRQSLVAYLTAKPRAGKTWARALAVHAREYTARYASGSVSRVSRLHQSGIFEYWFRQRVKRVPLAEFMDSDDSLWSPTSLQEVASAISQKAGKPWVEIIPKGLRAFFVLEVLEESTEAQFSGKHRTQRVYAAETQCTPRREWTEEASEGLASEVQNWLKYVLARNPTLIVVGFRTHLWFNVALSGVP